ncbi:MAG: hypothetical protein WC444_06000 [Candidatus Paceibacterota bacterium]
MKPSKRNRKAFNECLLLWKELSNTPSTSYGNLNNLKGKLLDELGIGPRKFDCPFCELYNYAGSGVNYCVLGLCNNKQTACSYTPYRAWEKELLKVGHSQELATDFYNYLLELYEKMYKEKWKPK